MKTSIAHLLNLMLIVSVLASGCVAPAAPTGGADTGSAAAPAAESPTGIEPTNCFVPNELIITGSRDAIQSVIGQSPLSLEEVNTIDLSYLAAFLEKFMSELPQPPLGQEYNFTQAPQLLPFFPVSSYSTLVTSVYQIMDGTDPLVAVTTINNIGNAQNVFADPNYLIGQPDLLTGGSGHFVTGGRAFGEHGASLGLTPTQFWQQWAFGKDGIGIIDDSGERITKLTGEGVRVGVFDTSPCDAGDNVSCGSSAAPLRLGKVVPMSPRMNVNPPLDALEMNEHGLFVAGLVHGVAPGSTIHLYQVLDRYAQGTLDTLIAALKQFMEQALNDRNNLKGIVINLSLGVYNGHDKCFNGQQMDPRLESLLVQLIEANRAGMIVVAAAGNDGSATNMDIPARYGVTLGVAASNRYRTQSCFSNVGRILAPGGEGDANCQVALESCSIDTCDFGLTSFATTSPTGFTTGTGTSFSTPLVSGLAALMLEQEGNLFKSAFDVGGSWMTFTFARSVYCDEVPQPTRIVSVGDTLFSACLQYRGALVPQYEKVDDLTYTATSNDPLALSSTPKAVISRIWNDSDSPFELTHVDGNGSTVTINLGPASDTTTNFSDALNGMTVQGTWTVKFQDAAHDTPSVYISWKAP